MRVDGKIGTGRHMWEGRGGGGWGQEEGLGNDLLKFCT